MEGTRHELSSPALLHVPAGAEHCFLTLEAEPGTLVLATEDPNGVNPHPRLTLTLPAINSARLAVFTVSGASKAPAVAALVRGDDLPAARVHAGRTLWLVDGAARADAP